MSPKTIAVSVLTGLTGLTGCTVGPDYRASTPAVPHHWQATKTTATAEITPQPIDPAVLQDWWKSLGDTRLNHLIDTARANNLDLKIALARIEQARAERRGTRATLFPEVGVAGGGQRQDNPFPGLAPGIRYNLFELGFDALWEIDLFGRRQRQLEAATAELGATAAEYAQALVTLTADVTRVYVGYRGLQKYLSITRSNLASQQHTLKLTERLYQEGVGTRHDVVRARAQTEITEAQIPALETDQIAVLRQLEVLLGQQPGTLADLATEEPIDMTLPPNQAILAAPVETLRHRPDIHAAERRLAAATALQGAAFAEWFPKVSLSAFLGFRNTDLEALFKSTTFAYGTTANLLQPLFNFGRIQAGIDLADARQREACLLYEKTVLEALRETETAMTHYLKEVSRQQTLERSVADLQESVRLSQRRYEEGVISFLEVLDAQRTLYLADLELARSKAVAITQLIAVYKALGGGNGGGKYPIVSSFRQGTAETRAMEGKPAVATED